MQVCPNKSKAIVIFRFGSNPEQRLTIGDLSPNDIVDVETVNFGNSLDDKKCYKIDYINCQGISGTSYLCSSKIEFITSGQVCGNGWIKDAEGSRNPYNSSQISASISVVNGFNIPDGQCGECISGCGISIKRNNQIILEKSGVCPITWRHSCEEECPEGYLKCECDNYPGYKCIPCGEIAGKLNSIEGHVNRLLIKSLIN